MHPTYSSVFFIHWSTYETHFIRCEAFQFFFYFFIPWECLGQPRNFSVNPHTQLSFAYVFILIFKTFFFCFFFFFFFFNGTSTFLSCRRTAEVLLTYNLGDKGGHAFPKDICPKVNIIVQLEFKLNYYDDVTVQHISNYVMETTPQRFGPDIFFYYSLYRFHSKGESEILLAFFHFLHNHFKLYTLIEGKHPIIIKFYRYFYSYFLSELLKR